MTTKPMSWTPGRDPTQILTLTRIRIQARILIPTQTRILSQTLTQVQILTLSLSPILTRTLYLRLLVFGQASPSGRTMKLWAR